MAAISTAQYFLNNPKSGHRQSFGIPSNKDVARTFSSMPPLTEIGHLKAGIFTAWQARWANDSSGEFRRACVAMGLTNPASSEHSFAPPATRSSRDMNFTSLSNAYEKLGERFDQLG